MKHIIIFLFFMPLLCCGQKKIDLNQGTIAQSTFHDTIPFELVRDKIIVAVQIQNQKKRFIFDTGATLMISEEIQAENKYEALETVDQSDAVGTSRKVQLVTMDEFELGKIKFQKIPAVVTNVKAPRFLNCLNYDGFIGSNALRNCIVQINLEDKYLVISNEISKLDIKNTFKTNLHLDKQSGPHIMTKIGEKVEFEGLFDSGSDEFMAISEDTYDKIEKKKLSRLLNNGFGSNTLALHSIEKQQKKQRVSISGVNFGDYVIRDFVSIISSGSTENAFGLGLAKYGNITIDYINKDFYFQPLHPIQTFSNKTTLGFIPIPNDEYVHVGIVWTNTNAEKLGLRSGFRILKINDIDFSERSAESDCALFLQQPFKESIMTLKYIDDNNEIKTITLNQE